MLVNQEEVKKYCICNNKDEIGADTIKKNFKYVEQKYFYVVRDDAKHIIAIMCNYKFDSENGIAIVFENEKYSRIGKQDLIL